MTEADIQKGILGYLALRKHFSFRVNTQGVPLWNKKQVTGFRPSPMRGVADIIGVVGKTNYSTKAWPGMFFAIEVKAPKGKTSEEQEKFLKSVANAGGIGVVARSIEDVKAVGL